MCQGTFKTSEPVTLEMMTMQEQELEEKLEEKPTTLKESRRRLLLKRSLVDQESSISSTISSTISCSDTEDETLSEHSSSDSEDEEEEIQLITRPRSNKTAAGSQSFPQAFATQLQQAAADPSFTSLRLHNFVERSTRHDVYALRDLLLQEDREWTAVRLEDDCPSRGFRRWAYKKENVNHHIQKLCLKRNIPLEYHAHINLNVDDMSLDSTLNMLTEIKKHPEIRQLDIVGHLNQQEEETLLKTVTSLLRMEDRDWDAVNIHTGFATTTNANEYEAWRELMIQYMGIFSQLYTKYNIPIDIRPCA